MSAHSCEPGQRPLGRCAHTFSFGGHVFICVVLHIHAISFENAFNNRFFDTLLQMLTRPLLCPRRTWAQWGMTGGVIVINILTFLRCNFFNVTNCLEKDHFINTTAEGIVNSASLEACLLSEALQRGSFSRRIECGI